MTTDEEKSARGYEAFISGVAESMGLGDGVQRPGTTVVPADDRAESSMVVAYSISEHTVLWCDPAIADDLAELADPTVSKSHEELSSWAERVGWEVVSFARMQLLRESGVAQSAIPVGVVMRALDRQQAEDVALIDAFKATLSDDDLDEADLDGDRLDEHILAALDERGIAAFASQQPFFYADGFGDIAIANAARCRAVSDSGGWPSPRCATRSRSGGCFRCTGVTRRTLGRSS